MKKYTRIYFCLLLALFWGIGDLLADSKSASDCPYTVELIITNSACGEEDGGSAVAIIEGDTGPYRFTWRLDDQVIDTANTPNNMVTGLKSGFLRVDVFDASDCVLTDTGIVIPFTGLPLKVDSMNISCNGEKDGTITIIPMEGTEPYTFKWSSNLANQASHIGLSPNMYSVVVTDNDGCESDTTTITIEEPDLLTASIDANSIEAAKCFDSNTGSAKVNISGGTGDKTVIWKRGTEVVGMGETVNSLPAGLITVEVTDQNDCKAMDMVTIGEPEPFTAEITVVNNILCRTNQSGILQVTPSGGTGAYTYEWSGEPSEVDNNEAKYDEPGSYTVTIKDGNECSTEATDSLSLEGVPEFTNPPEFLICQDNTPNSITISVEPTDAVIVWQIMNPENINPNSPTILSGSSPNPITVTLDLEVKRIKGSAKLEVRPAIDNCKGDSLIIPISLSPTGPVFVPEVFTPNGDGSNDEWVVMFPPEANPDDFSIQVFSRNGKKVYEANSMSEPWTGHGCPEGPYYFIIKDKDNNEYRGAVSILR